MGNTARVAALISERISCDVHEIRAAEAYPDAYEPTVERNAEEIRDQARPVIAGDLPDVSGYQTILLGSPIWAMQAPLIMSTFIESVDLRGKTILPFVTHAGSGLSGVDEDYRAALPESRIGPGLAIRGEEAASASPQVAAQVEEWLRTVGL